MDPFEEFEFKPLTDGLGFHKKKAAAAAPETAFKPEPAAALLRNNGLELLEESSTDLLRPPLPRKARTTNLPEVPGSLTEVGGNGNSTTAVDDILKTLQKNRRLDVENKKARAQYAAPAGKEELKKATFSFSAFFIDAMLVIAASLLCMIILLMITRVDLVANLMNPDAQGMIYLATVSLFAGVSFIYLTANRIILGFTPGEWAFDQRVGQTTDMNTASYSLRVVFRSALVIFSGFIALPILSILFNKDIAGQLSGAQLYKKA